MVLGRGIQRFLGMGPRVLVSSSGSEVTAAVWLRRLGLVGQGEVELRGLGPR